MSSPPPAIAIRSARPASSTRSTTRSTRILTLAKTEGMLFKWGSGTGTNLSSIRGSMECSPAADTASGPLSFMRGFDAFAGVIKSGGKTRRAAKMVILNVDHPDIVDFIECKAKEEAKAFTLIKAGYDGSGPDSEAYSSIFFQNANNSVRVTDEFMRAYETDGDFTTHTVKDHEAGKDLQGPRHHAQDRRGHLAVRRSGHAVRHHHQQVAHQQEHGPHQRVQSLLGVHVPRQLRLQPGQLQPAEVRHAVRHVRHPGLSPRHLRRHHGDGDPGGQLRLSDRVHREELARLSPARSWLRQPRRAAHGLRPAVRLRRRTRSCGRAHRHHVRTGLSAVGRARGQLPVACLRQRRSRPAWSARAAPAPAST